MTLKTDFQHIDDLMIERNKLAREANKRLYALEKAGYKNYVYKYTVTTIREIRGGKRRRFEAKKKYDKSFQSAVSLRSEIMIIQHFLDSKTSTVEGASAYEERVVESFKTRGLKVSNVKSFFNFLSSELYKSLANSKMDSEVLQDFFDKAVEKNLRPVDIYNKLRQYEKGDIGVKDLYKKSGLSFIDKR